MNALETKIESHVIQLAEASLKAFCADAAAMFGADIKCEQMEATTESAESLKNKIKSPAAVYVVEAKGKLNGKFRFMLDHDGIIILGGIIAMMPEDKILQDIKSPSPVISQNTLDALNETGNLLTGTWDRIFRDGFQEVPKLERHKNFVQKLPVFIGLPWNEPDENINLSDDKEILFIPYKITCGNFPCFTAAAAFSKNIFETRSDKPLRVSDVAAEAALQEDRTAHSINKEGPVSDSIAKMVAAASDILNVRSESCKDQSIVCANISAKKIMSNNIIWVNSEDGIQQAIDKMEQHNAGYLIVGQDEKIEGIVSRADAAGAISPYLRPMFSKWKRPLDESTLNIKLKWIMSRPVYTVTEDASIYEVMKKMNQHKIRCLPVVNVAGKVLGIITAFNIFKTILLQDETESINQI